MEKSPMYTVMTPDHLPDKRQWVAWAGVGVGVVALVVAGVTAALAVRGVEREAGRERRLGVLEGKVEQLEADVQEILELTLVANDYFDYLDYDDDDEEELDDHDHHAKYPQMGAPEHLTLQRVLRRRRDTNDLDGPVVPIFDQSYGADLEVSPGPRSGRGARRGGEADQGRSTSEGLRLYESFQATRGRGDPSSPRVMVEATQSPIRPHHRISSTWSSKDGPPAGPPPLATRSLSPGGRQEGRGPQVLQRNSRTKGPGGQAGPRRSHLPASVHFRHARVKSTAREERPKAVSPLPPLPPHPLPRVVQQEGQLAFSRGPQTQYAGSPSRLRAKGSQRKTRRLRKKNMRRRRSRARPALSLAHFVAVETNSTAGSQGQHRWTPAAWMEKLGLNRKYSLDHDSVIVKEAGLYYLYAQVLYESGGYGSGYQVLVDDIPVLECTLTPATLAPSCHTAGASYLPQNAAVSVRELDQYNKPVMTHRNTFFGLVKLLQAPDSAEQLLLA